MEEMAPSETKNGAGIESIAKKIVSKIHTFDLISLIRLLFYYGVQPEEILFKSHMSICSQSGLIQHIEFQLRPERRVTITINMGLLSAQSALPSYFQKNIAARDIDNQIFADFIGYFDHVLIQNYIFNLYPENNPKYFSNWERTKRDYLKLMDLKSCSTLFWIFELAFPELKIQVEKITVNRDIKAAALIMGKTILGSDSVFGRRTTVPVYGRHVTLFSNQETTVTGTPWPKEIQIRLENRVFPVLRSAEIDLEITLIIKTQKRWMKLHAESYLGYDKMKGGEAQYRRIRIYRGLLREG
jgi:hypothetical protein